jgi:hypothetical protein
MDVYLHFSFFAPCMCKLLHTSVRNELKWLVSRIFFDLVQTDALLSLIALLSYKMTSRFVDKLVRITSAVHLAKWQEHDYADQLIPKQRCSRCFGLSLHVCRHRFWQIWKKISCWRKIQCMIRIRTENQHTTPPLYFSKKTRTHF